MDGPLMPWIGFVFVMGHMSVNHVYRQIANSPDKIDITGNPPQYKHGKTIFDICYYRSTNGAGHESRLSI